MSRWLVAQTEAGGRSRAGLQLVTAALERFGHDLSPIRLPASGLPAGIEPIDFKDTPAEVVESWRVARHLDAATRPGDVVVISDRDAVGAVFALEQSARGPDQRRRVLLIGADGPFLSNISRAGTPGRDRLSHWERAAFQAAAATLTTSEWATAHLDSITARVAMVVAGVPRPRSIVSSPPAVVWLPEPVGRASQTGAILRALVGVPDVSVVASEEDVEDGYWHGTTWEALAGTRRLLAGRLTRGGPPAAVDTVILGDPTRVPSAELRRLRDEDVRFVVAAGSTAAALWPEADVWRNEDDLEAVLMGAGSPPGGHGATSVEFGQDAWEDSRGRRVSVGVPVFGRIDHLDECIASIIGQTQPPHEVILYDDGSRSEEVTAALQRWRDEHPDLIRLMEGPNRGVCVARNNILDEMAGDAFVLVDSDDRLDPTFIEKCAIALRANPGWSAAASWTEFFGDYSGVEAKPPFDRLSGWDENPIVSTCVLVDMAVREAGIRFAPDLAFLFCEDWEFWAHMVAAGHSFGLVPEPLAFHRADPGSGGGYQRTDLAYAAGRERARDRLRSVTR